jgi:hypothetical protein
MAKAEVITSESSKVLTSLQWVIYASQLSVCVRYVRDSDAAVGRAADPVVTDRRCRFTAIPDVGGTAFLYSGICRGIFGLLGGYLRDLLYCWIVPLSGYGGCELT